ncbi:MAG: TIG domain-containing protein [Pyrinomonadaceae bacterium]
MKNPFEGKSPAERNKIIAAAVLGVLALFSLYMAFGPSTAGSTSVVVTATPTVTPIASPGTAAINNFELPSAEDQLFGYQTTPIAYSPGNISAPDAGRNIFAFYEPPPPTPFSPTPFVSPTPTPATPTPVPPMLIALAMPQSVYEGTGAFRLEISGDKFSSDAKVYFNQVEIPTTFISPEKLAAEIPANLVTGEGPRQVIVQTPDGKRYSNQLILTVEARPKPAFKYIGMIGRKRYNNDTAYFLEAGKPVFTHRLNDIVAGRFRLLSISAEETVFEDVNLGFRHSVPMEKASLTAAPVTNTRGRRPSGGNYVPYNPNIPNYNPPQPQPQPQIQTQDIPGIPNNIPRYTPPSSNRPPPTEDPTQKKDVDDNEEDDEP